MSQRTVALVKGHLGCDLCKWLQTGYNTAEGPDELLNYLTEITLHQRMFHIIGDQNPN